MAETSLSAEAAKLPTVLYWTDDWGSHRVDEMDRDKLLDLIGNLVRENEQLREREDNRMRNLFTRWF